MPIAGIDRTLDSIDSFDAVAIGKPLVLRDIYEACCPAAMTLITQSQYAGDGVELA